MKILLRNTFLFSLLMIGTVINAQKGAEEIITESSEPASDKYVDDIVQRRLIVENRVLPYEPVREADIAWQKTIYRVIDTREKINLPFRYPLKSFFEILRELGTNGDIVTFKDEAGFPDFSNPLTAEQLEGRFYKIDTSSVVNYETYEEEIKIVKSEVFYQDINRYRVKEMWYFDEEASVLKVRILGVAPVKDVIDEDTGVVKYPEILFWIYYPEAREYLSKHQVFNEDNDIAPMTWSDLFEQRHFASYIYKQTNVLDYRVQDYFNSKDAEQDGIDMLLESEKIRMELFNFEHDLWTY